MPTYLDDVPLDAAWSRWIDALREARLWEPLGMEEIPVSAALGRIAAQPITARVSSPHYHAAAMDGYAVRSRETAGASDRAPITLELETQAQYVDTGDPMPGWADAVIPVEVVELIPEGAETAPDAPGHAIRVRAAAAPWSNVRPMGEDMVATELVIPSGRALQAVDLGAIAACGYDTVPVWRKPRVAIIPTGSELVPAGTHAAPGEIIESNSIVLAAQVESWGGQATRLPIVPDQLDLLEAAVAQAGGEHDLVLINAGSSAGSEDHTAAVISSLGEALVHGIAVRPGHPVILGMLHLAQASKGPSEPEDPTESGNRTHVPVIGVPGYPVSAALTGEIFIEPLVARWTGRQQHEAPKLEAIFTRKYHSSLGDDEYVRVTAGRVGDRLVAAPLQRGAGVITSLVRADGIVIIPAGKQGITAGERVSVRLYRTPDEIERAILVQGSHDMSLDLLAQHLMQDGIRLTSANLGSLGGLMALKRGEAHLAGSHLLDPESGEFNQAYVRRYLPDVPVVIMALVEREQGLILAPGNPGGIQDLEDLVREGVRFVNRQRGSGTRVLLDYHLEQKGIAAAQIQGYSQEEYTHLAVAAAVASGSADAGLAIRAAAAALNLYFIPLYRERYDLILPRIHYESAKLQPLIARLSDPEFRAEVARMPGYHIDLMGTIIAETGG